MDFLGNETNRFGSAAFATHADIRRAGLFRQHAESLFIGFFNGKPLWYSGAGGVMCTAGARSGKLRDVLAYNLCSGICLHTMLVLDMKGELAFISQNQTTDQKYNIYWNPLFLHGLPCHRLNPLEILTIDSPSLVSDVKATVRELLPLSGSPQGEFFESRAQEYLEAIFLSVAKRDGVVTFSAVFAAMNLLPGGGDKWLDFAYDMQQSGFPIAARIEEEIAEARSNPNYGYQGIIGEMFKALACLSDPILLASVSPPYDFSLADLCSSKQAYQFYIMPPAEMIESWAAVLKSIFVGAMLFKSRAPSAPRQTWILDECAQLGKFPLIQKLFTYGAGIGIRPFAVLQSTQQLRAIGKDAETIVPSSAACQILFGLRDLASATECSRRLGAQSLEFDDQALQARAQHSKQQALQALLNGGDPLSATLNYAHHKDAATRRTKQHRLLQTPDEVLNTSPDRAYIFSDGLAGAIYAERKPYYEQRFMAGRYFSNPYHPPVDRVRVKTRLGHSVLRMVRERVPARFAGYPQYADGTWTTLKG